jgi:hypothetical protein
MTTKSPLAFRPPSPTAWILAVLALASFSVLADDAGTPDPADRVYVLDGATISWDLDRRRFHPPTARQTSRLAEELRLWMEAKQAGGEGPFAAEEITVETLPGGVKRARLPLRLMSFAVAGGEDAGHGANLCADGLAAAETALNRPAALAAEEK